MDCYITFVVLHHGDCKRGRTSISSKLLTPCCRPVRILLLFTKIGFACCFCVKASLAAVTRSNRGPCVSTPSLIEAARSFRGFRVASKTASLSSISKNEPADICASNIARHLHICTLNDIVLVKVLGQASGLTFRELSRSKGVFTSIFDTVASSCAIALSRFSKIVEVCTTSCCAVETQTHAQMIEAENPHHFRMRTSSSARSSRETLLMSSSLGM